MDRIAKDSCLQWADGQGRTLDDRHEDGDGERDGDSDSSSSPLVTKHLVPVMGQKGLPGSPRRNGMVLDANVRSIFSLRAAYDFRGRSRSRSQSPTKYQD